VHNGKESRVGEGLHGELKYESCKRGREESGGKGSLNLERKNKRGVDFSNGPENPAGGGAAERERLGVDEVVSR